MTRLEFLVDTRQRLMREISGTQNAGSLYWDDTRSNFLTQNSVKALFIAVRKNAEALGLAVVNCHWHCGRTSHREEYYVSTIMGRNIAYRDPAFAWVSLSHSEAECTCPCSPDTNATKHSILTEIIYIKGADSRFFNALASILQDIYRAMENAGRKRPRSGIREYLLRALLATNDQILPQSVDEFIASQTSL